MALIRTFLEEVKNLVNEDDDFIATEVVSNTPLIGTIPYVFDNNGFYEFTISLTETGSDAEETFTSYPFNASFNDEYNIIFQAVNESQQTDTPTSADINILVNSNIVFSQNVDAGSFLDVEENFVLNAGDEVTVDIVIPPENDNEDTQQAIFIGGFQAVRQITLNNYTFTLEKADESPNVDVFSFSIARNSSDTINFSFEAEKNDELVFTADAISDITINSVDIIWDEQNVIYFIADEIPDTNIVYEPRVNPGEQVITTRFSDMRNKAEVLISHVLSIDEPDALKLLAGDSESNVITDVPIGPNIDFYEIPNEGEITQTDLLSSTVNALLPSYIPSEDAIFSNSQYTSFYVKNDSLDFYQQIFFDMNGGERISVQNLDFSGSFYEADNYSLPLDLDENLLLRYKSSGQGNYSLFNQLNISYSVAQKNTLLRVPDEDVVSNLDFVDARQESRLPDLGPGEYVGIYLKIDSLFNVDLDIPVDFSFMHFTYSNATRNDFVQIPGQTFFRSKNKSNYGINVMPSVALRFVTNYERLVKLISDTTEELYANYPPFFLYYEEDLET